MTWGVTYAEMRPKPLNKAFESVEQIVCTMVSDCIEIGHRL